MSNVNPYAYSPGQNPFGEQIVQAQPVPAGPQATMWRKGNMLVMYKLAPFPPDVCILSNQQATRKLRRNLQWHPQWIGLLVLIAVPLYIIVSMIMRKTAKLDIPLSEAWYQRRITRMFIAWGSVLAAFISMGLGIALADNPIAPLFFLSFFGLLLFGIFFGIFSCRLVHPDRIDDNYVWLKGVHPDYLNRLPQWPYNP